MPDPTEPTFEQSLARLQELVDQLEDGQLTLTQSLAAYEEGIKHLKSCHAALTETERKIEILSGFNSSGEPITRPFDDAATETHENENVARRTRRAGQRAPGVSEGRTPGANASGSHDDDVDDRRELF
jgi:exodeoxyribonuclease VII small subunit